MSGSVEGRIAYNLFEGLTRKHPKTLEPLPGVANSWQIKNGYRTYIFQIRSNAKWSNGKKLTAQDFVYSWQRVLSPETASRYASFLYLIKNGKRFHTGKIKDPKKLGIRALPGNRLLVELSRPAPYFLEMTSFYITFPTPGNRIKRFGANWTKPENILCNGPFILKKWSMHNRIVLTKNNHYWGKNEVQLNKAIFLPIEDAGTALNLYRSGVVDVLYSYPLEMHQFLSTKKDRQMQSGWGVYYYMLNTTKAPLNKRIVRRALALAIDKKTITKKLLRQGQRAAYSFTPPFLKNYTPPKDHHFNPLKARALLAQAGYKNGKNFPALEILYNTKESHKHIAEVIQKMWQKHLNIKVSLINQEWKVYLNTRNRLEYMVCRAGWVGDFFSPVTFLDIFMHSGGNNGTGWTRKEYTRLITQAIQTTNMRKRARLFKRAETILLHETPIIPLYIYSFNILVKPYIAGIYANLRDEHPLRDVRILKKRKE